MLDTKVKVFHEMTLKLYFMKSSERKISQCILPFKDFTLQIIKSFFVKMKKRCQEKIPPGKKPPVRDQG